jgi:hypothetical protein
MMMNSIASVPENSQTAEGVVGVQVAAQPVMLMLMLMLLLRLLLMRLLMLRLPMIGLHTCILNGPWILKMILTMIVTTQAFTCSQHIQQCCLQWVAGLTNINVTVIQNQNILMSLLLSSESWSILPTMILTMTIYLHSTHSRTSTQNLLLPK